jgi:hypothetical protein
MLTNNNARRNQRSGCFKRIDGPRLTIAKSLAANP